MATWRVFMSPSRDISDLPDVKNSFLKEEQEVQRTSKPTITRSTHKKEEKTAQFKTVQSTTKQIQQQRPSSSKRPQPRKLINELPVRDLSQSFEADRAFIQSSQQPHQDENILEQLNIIEDPKIEQSMMKQDLSNIKKLMVQNNHMIHLLNSKLEIFQKDKQELYQLKKQLEREQRTNRTINHRLDNFQNQLGRIQQLVLQQQKHIQQQQEYQHHFSKRRSKSSIVQNKFQPMYEQPTLPIKTQPQTIFFLPQKAPVVKKHKPHSHSQVFPKRKIPDLDLLKQNIRQALQDVYYEYLD